MSAFDFVTSASRTASRPAVATRVANTVANFYRTWKNRSAFNQLDEMTNAELADIGLTRTDLRIAANVPFGSDPTLKLRSLSDRRARTAEDDARNTA